MLNRIISKDNFKSFDAIFGFCILFLAVYFMLSTEYTLGGEAKILDSVVLSEIRSNYYVGEESQATLVVFETSWCGICKSLKKELATRGLKYKAIDVEKSRDIYKLYQKVYGDNSGPVPVTVAGRRVIVGSRVNKIVEALEEKL